MSGVLVLERMEVKAIPSVCRIASRDWVILYPTQR